MRITGKKAVKPSFVSDFAAGFSENYQKNRDKFQNSKKNNVKSYKESFVSAKNQTFLRVNGSKIIRPLSVAVISFLVGLFVGRAFSPVVKTSALTGEDTEPRVSLVSISEEKEKEDIKRIELPEINKASIKNDGLSANFASTGAASSATPSSYALEIPSIGLKTSVIPTYVDNNNDIVVPDSAVGALTNYHGNTFYNKTLLVGHRTGIFAGLGNVTNGAIISYQGKAYTVISITQSTLSRDDMRRIIADSLGPDTVVLMTCAGPNYSERLVITAIAE